MGVLVTIGVLSATLDVKSFHRLYLTSHSGDVRFKHIQGVPGGKVNILGGYSIGHSKQKTLYEHVSYSERFPR